MVTTKIAFHHKEFSDELLNKSISDLLNKHNSLALASIKDNTSYINTGHYGFDEHLKMVVFTQPYTQHSQNIEKNPSVAIAIWTEPAIPGTDLQGVQLFGECVRVPDNELQEAIDVYTSHNPSFSNLVKVPKDFETAPTESRLYWVKIKSLKLIDEPAFGKRNFISLEVK
jgi:uncharacterized protein YhbP (UPF0306 family)